MTLTLVDDLAQDEWPNHIVSIHVATRLTVMSLRVFGLIDLLLHVWARLCDRSDSIDVLGQAENFLLHCLPTVLVGIIILSTSHASQLDR